ncbi:inorganic phosphate transporter [Candidatus Legionella polyplacis]|uniref:Phosphate transporter n=1 Tax=Candidatus Legionella polyplacis TaxID=2005262 RepID=A0ABZ2GZQ2_9GAMM
MDIAKIFSFHNHCIDHVSILIVSSTILFFLMTWGIGANDLGNIMSTTIGAKIINLQQITFLIIIFEFTGAFIGGNNVTNTIRDNIININQLHNYPIIIIKGMLSSLISCTIWMNLSSYFGLPVSITNALVGSMIGFGTIVLGPYSVNWKEIIHITTGWIISPFLSGITSYIIFLYIKKNILYQKKMTQSIKYKLNLYLFLVISLLTFIIIFKILKHFNIHLTINKFTILNLLIGILITIIIYYVFINKKIYINQLNEKQNHIQIEKYFSVLMILTACAMIFAHGSNDISLAIGPLSVIYKLITKVHLYNHKNYIINHQNLNLIKIVGCIGVISGFLTYGKKVINTVGNSITSLNSIKSFAATFSTATIVVIANNTGLPISVTQTLVGSIFGIGMEKGKKSINLFIVSNIVLSWIITMPATFILSIISFKILMLLI